jgi:hypothetical protein
MKNRFGRGHHTPSGAIRPEPVKSFQDVPSLMDENSFGRGHHTPSGAMDVEGDNALVGV